MTRLALPRWTYSHRARRLIVSSYPDAMRDVIAWAIGEPDDAPGPTRRDFRDAARVWCMAMFAFALWLATAAIGGWW